MGTRKPTVVFSPSKKVITSSEYPTKKRTVRKQNLNVEMNENTRKAGLCEGCRLKRCLCQESADHVTNSKVAPIRQWLHKCSVTGCESRFRQKVVAKDRACTLKNHRKPFSVKVQQMARQKVMSESLKDIPPMYHAEISVLSRL